MGRPPNGKSTTINGTRTTNLRAPKPTTTKGSSPTNAGVTKTQSDRSQLNFPYDIRLSGFTSIQNAVSKGTPKIRRILTEECDYIMECRICRNLFRSLPNFITHKLNYCKKVFDSTWCIGLSNLVQTTDRMFNIEYEVDPELLVDDKESNYTENTRSVSEMYEELATKVQRSSNVFEQTSPTNENIVRLKIKPLVNGPSGTVVLQQQSSSDPSNCDVSSSIGQPIETVEKDSAILGPDGKIVYTGASKGIEEVVSRLSSKLKALEEKKALSTCAGATMALACDVCKTVFETEKALRQHKREGLDCGRTWGSKSPIKTSNSNNVKAGSDNGFIPSKRFKNNADGLSSPVSSYKNSSRRIEVTAAEFGKPTKLSSPVQSRRYSHKTLQSPSKRGLSMSPVKKIKMKYSKLDCGNTFDDRPRPWRGDTCLSCNNCSSSFNTKHEMSMHLALCNGVINYAFLGGSEPPEEKIRISIRNEFVKSNLSGSTFNDDNSGHKNKHRQESVELILLEQSAESLSDDDGKRISNSKDPHSLVWNSGALQVQEVNNNKQYQRDDSSESKDMSMTNIAQEASPDIRQESASSPKILKSNVSPLDVSDHGSLKGASSNDVDVITSLKEKDIVTLTPSPSKSRKSKPSKVNVVAQVITRLDKRGLTKVNKSQKGFNLRKAVSARLRKSGRISTSHV